jgi:hypothetical protein
MQDAGEEVEEDNDLKMELKTVDYVKFNSHNWLGMKKCWLDAYCLSQVRNNWIYYGLVCHSKSKHVD